MTNRVVLIGRLTKDVELKSTPSGAQVCSFSIAVDNRYTKDNEKSASFFNCVAWQNSAKIISQYCKKGSLIAIDGRLQSRSYVNKDGRNVSVVEVVCENVQLLSPKDSNSTNNNDSVPSNTEDDDGITFSENDLPF